MSLYKNYPHDSAKTHVTGKSQFILDRPALVGEVLVGIVGAPMAAGTLTSIKKEKALGVKGILGIYTAQDFKRNLWGTIVQDQPLLVDKEIGYHGEPICLIAAENKESLLEAKKLIEFEISQKNPLLNLSDAINGKNFLYTAKPFIKGAVDVALGGAAHKLSGDLVIGGQEHFYLETQASIAIPVDGGGGGEGEGGQIEVHSSSQHPTETQHLVAHALGLPFHSVICSVKRMGGAFGGKESQAAAFAAYVALVAHKLGRSARLCITQDEDMKITGKRHPFHNFYEVGFDQSGKILALKAKLYADGGAYTDLSPSILDRALFHIDGAYNIPHAHIEGFVCKTNHHSNTAFRGFGGPQGMLTIENIMEDIAKYLNKDAMEIRKANCYKVGDTTPYGQSIDEPNLEKLFSTFPESADYFKRRIDVESFNKSNLSKVRGLSCTAMKFGIAFTAKHLNQGNALVHVLTDGSVQVSTGATEMGQGVYIKVQQTVAECLGISVDRVKVMATSTDKNANTSPTAASSGSDINCAAAKNACDKIRRRLAYLANLYFENKISDPMVDLPEASQDFQSDILSFSNDVIENKASGKNISFTELVQKAYLHRIYLSEHAHYKTEGIGFDKSTQKGTPFKYFTNGISVSEVEVDKYTGEMKVLRADVMMDLGRSVNPAIDHGQVAGAFIQGMGWLTSENLFYSAAGELLSHSPTTYKVPNIQDTPRIFNISFLENTSNEKNVFGTKAVGEPPLLLANSVWTAVKDAIHNGRMQSGRVQSGKNDLVKISTPAIPEVILMELEREI